MNKYLRELLLVGIFLLGILGIVASGGGGGGEDSSTEITYSGNTDPAVISTTNATRLVGNVIVGQIIVESTSGGAAKVDTSIDTNVQGVGLARIPGRLARILRNSMQSSPEFLSRSSAVRARTDLDETEPCDNSGGSIQITGFIEDNGTGTLTFVYINCREGDETLDGEITLQVNAFDFGLLLPTDAIFSFSVLTLSSTTYSLSLDGSIHSQISIGPAIEQLTVDRLVTRDNATGEMLMVTNQVSIIDYDDISFPSSFSENISGRIYDSTLGYVDFTTIASLIFSTVTQEYPDSGQLLLTGNLDSAIQVIAISDTYTSIGLDLDGDATFEVTYNLSWSEIEAETDLVDTDGDGMHDSWETLYGLNPDDGNDANQDLDGDWLSNIIEYQEFSIPDDASSYPANADIYDLDASFGVNGIAIYQSSTENKEGRAVAIQTDGKIVVTGFIFSVDRNNTIILRYNEDGTLDSTFGSNGSIIYSECDGCAGEGYAVEIQTDGKIVVSGYTVSGPSDTGSILLIRLNSDGTFDNTFGTNGRVVTNIAGYGDYGYDLAIQKNGKIVVAGRTATGTDQYALVLRYNSDGTLDNTFGTNGQSTYDGAGWDEAKSVALQQDGKIVVTGSTSDAVVKAFTDVLTLRYNADGTLDSSFGINGVVTYDYIYESGSAVIVQPDGAILVAGNIWDYNCENDSSFILRYAGNGTLDAIFGAGGVVSYNPQFDGCLYATAQSMAIKKDGKIITAGALGNKVIVLRYNSDGSLDTTFSREGYGIYSLEGDYTYAYGKGIGLQLDEKIIVTGEASGNDGKPVFIMRLQAH